MVGGVEVVLMEFPHRQKKINIPSRRITPIQEKKKDVGHFNDVKLMEVTVPSNS